MLWFFSLPHGEPEEQERALFSALKCFRLLLLLLLPIDILSDGMKDSTDYYGFYRPPVSFHFNAPMNRELKKRGRKKAKWKKSRKGHTQQKKEETTLRLTRNISALLYRRTSPVSATTAKQPSTQLDQQHI